VSPFDTLRALRQLGVAVELDGERLRLRAGLAAPDHLLAQARTQRDAIAALLRPDHHGWTEEDRLMAIEERAAILEYDGGLSRAQAEAMAREDHGIVTASDTARAAAPVVG
jgi:hypothetical protein